MLFLTVSQTLDADIAENFKSNDGTGGNGEGMRDSECEGETDRREERMACVNGTSGT